ncbi:hypothetical protein [Vibrio caribbeanicus]|nr:hypothetical protein [Vibrio caribbeanicus]
MMKSTLILLSYISISTYSLAAMNYPPTTGTCSNMSSSVDGDVYFDKNCRIAYVMPPEVGMIKSHRENFDEEKLALCTNYLSTKELFKINNQQILDIIVRRGEITNSLIEIEASIKEVQKVLDDFKTSNYEKIEGYESAKLHLKKKENAYFKIMEEAENCSRNCDLIEEELVFLESDYFNAIDDLLKLEDDYKDIEFSLRNFQHDIDTLNITQNELTDLLDIGYDSVSKAYLSLEEAFNHYSKIENGEIIYLVDLLRNETVQETKNRNLHTNLIWKEMPIYRAQVATNYAFENLSGQKIKDLLLVPSIGSYNSLNGKDKVDVINYSYNDRLLNVNFDYEKFNGDALRTDQFYTHLQTNLIGSCEAKNGKDFSALIAPRIYYEYGLNFPFSVTAKLNGKALLNHIEIRKSRRKYLFKKIRWTEIEDYKSYSHILDLEFDSDSSLLSAKIKSTLAKSMIDTDLLRFMNIEGRREDYHFNHHYSYSSKGGIFSSMLNDENVAVPRWTFTEEEDTNFTSSRYPFSSLFSPDYVNKFSKTIVKTYRGNYLIPQARIMTFKSVVNEN